MLATELEPVVVVTRHPDYQDEITVHYATARIVYVDLGATFDTTPYDADEAEEWANDTWGEVKDLPDGHGARDEVLGVIASTVADFFTVSVTGGELELAPIA